MKKAPASSESQKTPFPTKRDHPGNHDPVVDSPSQESFPSTDPASVTPGRQEGGGPHDNTRSGEKKAPPPSEDALDEGLEESFPASDPVSVGTKKPTKPAQ